MQSGYAVNLCSQSINAVNAFNVKGISEVATAPFELIIGGSEAACHNLVFCTDRTLSNTDVTKGKGGKGTHTGMHADAGAHPLNR